MPKQFNGGVNVDIRDSTPDWEPYAQPMAPEGAPNVLWIVLDDVGYAALEPFGGLIETPNLNRIAERGLRYTRMHTTALCSPTRAAMLTGRNHTTVGMACIAEATTGFPNGNGHIPFETATLAEILVERGWNTYALGKWHLCPSDEMNIASTKRNWPTGRGFERYYGFLGGETNQWYPDLVRDQTPIEQPYFPEDGYHLSKDLTDRAIEMIADAKQIAPDKPFFMYFAPGCAHAPHHIFAEWADRYKGKFDAGYEAYREVVLQRMQTLGIVPENAELSPLNPLADATSVDGAPWPVLDTVRPWDSLSDDEKRLFVRMAEVYAGFVSYTDDQLGRLLDYLQEAGQLDNTIIVVISDNGASGEGGPNGSVNENLFFNGIPDDVQRNLAMIDKLGSPDTYNHYPTGWAAAFCTPFKLWKRYAYNGGVSDPFIVSWPAQITGHGEIRTQYHHCIDVMPTILDLLGIELPDEVKGYTQWPLEGVSMRYSFTDAAAPGTRRTQYYTMLGTRGIYHDGWKANTVHPAVAGWGHFDADRWELYHVAEDPAEVHDLAESEPDRLEQLKGLWFHEAGKYRGLPLDDRSPAEIINTPRPQMVRSTQRYVYRPGTLEVPESAGPNLRGRPWKIVVDVTLDGPDASGVLVSQGAKFGGYALYLKDGHLVYMHSFVGIDEQVLRSPDAITPGPHVFGVEFMVNRIDQEAKATRGTAALYVDGDKVAEGDLKTQFAAFSLVGEGLNVGKDAGAPVTDDYPGTRPWAFTGGTIKEVVFDLSDEPYLDLEKEAWAVLARE